MTNEYNILLRTARWFRRFRKRCGYGVHSPFAFAFITGVVYNDEAYYAYEPLRRDLEPSIARLGEYDTHSGLTEKDLRLLFRVTNWAEPTTILLQGASDATASYIRAARTSAAEFTSLPLPSQPPLPSVLVYCDSPAFIEGLLQEATSLCSDADGELTIIVRGIHSTPEHQARWEHLKASPLCVMSFDLGRFGIIIKRPKINPQHYVANYF